jgi:hypothetical protein
MPATGPGGPPASPLDGAAEALALDAATAGDGATLSAAANVALSGLQRLRRCARRFAPALASSRRQLRALVRDGGRGRGAPQNGVGLL